MKKPTKKAATGKVNRRKPVPGGPSKAARKKNTSPRGSGLPGKVSHEMSLLLNNTDESFVLVNTDFQLIIFNKQFQLLYKKYFGKETKQGDSILDYAQPNRRDIVKQIYQAVFTGERLQSEIELPLPDGSINYFVNRFKPACNEEGKIIGAFVTISDITDKKEAERKISDERILLRTLIDNLPLNVYTKDLNSKKTLANRTDYEYAGFSSEAGVLGKDDLELFSEESARNTIAEDHLIFTTGQSIIGKEKQHIRKDGSNIWFLISKLPLRNANNEITGLLGISYNITERKEAQEKIRIAKERYDIVTKATNEAIWDWDMITNLVHWSDGFRTLFGHAIEKEVITLESWTSYIHPADEKRVIASIMQVVNSPETSKWEEEYRFKKLNGDYANVLDRGFVIRNAHGKPTRMIGAMQDMTQRKKAERSLRESEERYRTLTERVSDAFIAIDKEWNYTYVNNKASELIKHDPAYLIGKNMWEVSPESIDQPFYNALQEAMKTQQAAHLQLYYPPSGKWYEDYIYPTPDGMTVYYREITERKELELQLSKRAEELAASNSELEQFAYVASHDLQEPLRMVSSFLQLLQKKYNEKLDETAIQYITYAVDGAERMKQLIMDLLEYSRVGTNQDKRVRTDMKEVINQVNEMFATKISETNAVITVHPMPVIKVNKTQITQLIQNLIGNALKYNTSPVPQVEIGCEESAEFWEFWIKDNGIGIEPKFFEKVFVIFQRLHNKNQFSGTGIGLAICKKIVERHGGMIRIESAIDKGSTFFFKIRK